MPESPVKPVANDFSYLTDLYHGEFPKVLIQLPMYNEDAHCDLIIHRCCKIKWPSHRILIQVRPEISAQGLWPSQGPSVSTRAAHAELWALQVLQDETSGCPARIDAPLR
jgi:hypothetical protein